MAKKYVMGNRADGLSDILIEEEIVIPSVPGKVPGLDMWMNYETPADLSGKEDPTSGKDLVHEPPDGGAVFRIVRFMPNPGAPPTPEQVQAMHKSIGSVHIPSIDYLRTAKHPSMHKTDTLNYFVVVSGEMWMLSEGRDALVRPGDVIVQKGCMHGWKVDGPEPCVLAAVLIDAKPA